MERTYINEAQKAIGGTVKVQGFIENLRNSKYMAFIVLKDITGKLQITVEKADYYKEARPVITIVEPTKADCLYRTALANDGKLHIVDGALDSIMAGLCCGEPCSIGWQQLAAYADNFVAMPDKAAALGMRVLGNPVGNDI